MFARIVLMLAAIAWMVGVIVLIMSKSVMHEILAALLLSFEIIFGEPVGQKRLHEEAGGSHSIGASIANVWALADQTN